MDDPRRAMSKPVIGINRSGNWVFQTAPHSSLRLFAWLMCDDANATGKVGNRLRGSKEP